MAHQWVIQERLAKDCDDADWDSWTIGVIEDEHFIEKATTFDPEFASFMMTSFKWFEAFEGGVVRPAIRPVKLPLKAPTKRGKKV